MNVETIPTHQDGNDLSCGDASTRFFYSLTPSSLSPSEMLPASACRPTSGGLHDMAPYSRVISVLHVLLKRSCGETCLLQIEALCYV